MRKYYFVLGKEISWNWTFLPPHKKQTTDKRANKTSHNLNYSNYLATLKLLIVCTVAVCWHDKCIRLAHIDSHWIEHKHFAHSKLFTNRIAEPQNFIIQILDRFFLVRLMFSQVRLKLAEKNLYFILNSSAAQTSHRFQFIVERASFILDEWKMLFWGRSQLNRERKKSTRKDSTTRKSNIRLDRRRKKERKTMDISCSNLLNLMGKLVESFRFHSNQHANKRQSANVHLL